MPLTKARPKLRKKTGRYVAGRERYLTLEDGYSLIPRPCHEVYTGTWFGNETGERSLILRPSSFHHLQYLAFCKQPHYQRWQRPGDEVGVSLCYCFAACTHSHGCRGWTELGDHTAQGYVASSSATVLTSSLVPVLDFDHYVIFLTSAAVVQRKNDCEFC